MPLPTLITKPSPRLDGAELTITDEPHVVGEDEPNLVWLDEVPLQALSGASVTVPSFAELVPPAPGVLPPAPAPGEFRVFYSGLLTSAVEFNAADNGQALTFSYTGRGGTVVARDYNRIKIILEDTRTTLDDTVTSLGTVQTSVTGLQTDLAAVQTTLGETQTSVTGLQTGLTETQTSVTGLQTGLTETQTSVTGLQTDLAATQTTLAETQNLVEQNTINLNQASSTLTQTQLLALGARTVVEELQAVVTDEIPATYVAKGQDLAFDTVGALLRFNTSDGSAFAMGQQRFANAVGERENNVMRWGYNLGANGARIDSAKHALAFEIESYFHPLENKTWTEAHLAFTTVGGRLLRPFSLEADINAGDPGADASKIVRFRLEGDDLYFTNPGPTNSPTPGPTMVYMKLSSQGIVLPSALSVRHLVNNHSLLQQINAAGTTFVHALKVNAQDEVEVGSTSAKTYAPGGLILRSPNGSRFLLSVSNDGVLSATAL